MNGFKISFAIVAFVLVQGIAVIWYISKLDSKVNTMYTSFEEENRKEVIENQLKMKLDLANLVTEVSSLKKDLKKMRNKDKEIMEQHGQIFELLQDVTTPSTGSYSYD
jgi:seryl-tRNA synthetase|tara:strand:- start:55 stop:378 length:324 start_codon:yes stop_codon:yes gene_type:complete